jgi:hypothetical protein
LLSQIMPRIEKSLMKSILTNWRFCLTRKADMPIKVVRHKWTLTFPSLISQTSLHHKVKHVCWRLKQVMEWVSDCRFDPACSAYAQETYSPCMLKTD